MHSPTASKHSSKIEPAAIGTTISEAILCHRHPIQTKAPTTSPSLNPGLQAPDACWGHGKTQCVRRAARRCRGWTELNQHQSWERHWVGEWSGHGVGAREFHSGVGESENNPNACMFGLACVCCYLVRKHEPERPPCSCRCSIMLNVPFLQLTISSKDKWLDSDYSVFEPGASPPPPQKKATWGR